MKVRCRDIFFFHPTSPLGEYKVVGEKIKRGKWAEKGKGKEKEEKGRERRKSARKRVEKGKRKVKEKGES